MLGTAKTTRNLGIFALVGLMGLSACARNDNGAPVQWGRSYDTRPQQQAAYQTNIRRDAVITKASYQQPTAPKRVATTKPNMDYSPVTKNLPYQVEVQKGQNLYQIAQAHGTTVGELADYNGLKAPYTLSAGQMLGVPNTKIHVVQQGDTVYSISRRYRLETWELADLNDIKWPYTIHRGQELRVSGSIPQKRVKPDYEVRTAQAPAAATPVQKTSFGPTYQQTVEVSTLPAAKPATRKAAPAQQAAMPLPPSPSGTQGFIWPVDGKIISTYGPKTNGQHNDGINIATRKGAPVRAAKSGRVTYVGNELKNYGNLILIKHDNGYVTAYAHNSRMKVKEGQFVNQGQVIAEAGSTGDVKTTQVHFEIRKGRKSVNPNKYL